MSQAATGPTGEARGPGTFNAKVASMLRECGRLLREQDANPFRVNAYLHAASTIETLETDVREVLRQEGHEGLTELPAIGQGLAAAIEEIVRRGRLTRLDRLRGTADPELLLQSVPGIGPTLARLIHERLHVDTLEALEIAAHDGRLAALPGIGTRRLAAVRSGIASLLQRSPGRRPAHPDGSPSVAMLLDVDAEYRANEQRLPKLAPRRFNPEGKAWLPVLHTERHGWHFTALYSNTAKAHELGRTHDWVVIYFYDEDHSEGQHTVVTETYGALRGRRVVRGREAECAAHYA